MPGCLALCPAASLQAPAALIAHSQNQAPGSAWPVCSYKKCLCVWRSSNLCSESKAKESGASKGLTLPRTADLTSMGPAEGARQSPVPSWPQSYLESWQRSHTASFLPLQPPSELSHLLLCTLRLPCDDVYLGGLTPCLSQGMKAQSAPEARTAEF